MIVTLRNGFVLTERGFVKGNVNMDVGLIREIGYGARARGEVYDVEGLFVLPGFREQHMHDMLGMMRYVDRPERVGEVARRLVEQGVTAFKLATVAMPLEELLTYLSTCKKYMERPVEGGARFEGVFLEGTFINRACAGAQPPEYIIHPDEPRARKVLDEIIGSGAVKLINIVPDFGVELIEYASSKGLIVGCGHCKASARQLAEAVKAGLRFIVHITNGGMGQSFKPFEGGGTYEGALELPVHVEIIVDGFHVDMRYVSDIIERRLQRGRMGEVIVVTDRLFPSPDEAPSGEFRMFSVVCRKSEEEVLYTEGFYDEKDRFVKAPPYTLCGSLLTLPRAFENLVNLFTVYHSGFMIDVPARGLREAMWLASTFISSNQASLERRDDVGSLEPGKRADLTILSVNGEPGEYKVRVEATIVDGKLAYSRL